MGVTYLSGVKAELLKRFPDKRMPWGAASEIARDLGVTRQYIFVKARELGFTTYRLPREDVWNEEPCAFCGSPVRRQIKRQQYMVGKTHATPDGEATYTGRRFCDRHCFAQWLGHNFGRGAQKRKREELIG